MLFLNSPAFSIPKIIIRNCVVSLLLTHAFISFGSERTILNFNPDWKFIKQDPGTVAATVNYDDSSWATVSAPHTYNDVDTFNHKGNADMSGENSMWGGRTWYRKTFALPESLKGKNVYIEFEGVRQFGEVYINGKYLGVCKNGFIPFGFDLTQYLNKDGKPNVIAVMCDNRFLVNPDKKEQNLAKIEAQVNALIPEDEAKIQPYQIPWNHSRWHPTHGGIYRNVYLHITDPLHISLPLYDFLQTEGPYVYAEHVTEKSANFSAEIPIENNRQEAARVDITVLVKDASGKAVLVLNQTQEVSGGAKANVLLSGVITNPELWEPNYPYLYNVVCQASVAGNQIDSVTIPYGIRHVDFTTDYGFFINGHHLKLHGWGQRPTDEWPGLGTAQPDWLHEYTMLLMKQAGSNFMRWGHSAGGPIMITTADQFGLITDQPGVDGEADTVGGAWKIRTEAFRDLIIYYRNHPSILIWEAGNQKVSKAHAIEMRNIFKTYDPHGGRAEAYRRADQTDANYMDIGIGTEGGREIASLPVVEGEYDREESPRRIWDDKTPPTFGYPGAKEQAYQPFDSEEFAVHQVAQYVKKVSASNHSGGANWVFSDTTSGGRVDLETARNSGEVDGVRLPKEAYYVTKVLYSSTPQTHIIGHWNYPEGTKKTVYVASNGDDVQLFVNGRSLGHGKVSNRYLFTFSDVSYEAGEIKAVATNKGNAWGAPYVIRTAGPAVGLRMRGIMGPSGFKADGSDILLIDVEAVDAKGMRCPTFQQRVDFTYTGPVVWRGGWNSAKPGSINNTYLDLEAGINRVALRSTLGAGEITVKVKSAGLKSAEITLHSLPAQIIGGMSSVLPPTIHPKFPRVRPSHPASESYEQIVGNNKATQVQAVSQPGRFIKAFSYSGPTSIAHVEINAANDRNAYVDRDFTFSELPKPLIGADWVQAGDADFHYSALDFVVIGVASGTTLWVAHDDRLPRPSWLTSQFKQTQDSIMLKGKTLSLFRRKAALDETITFGSNVEDPAIKDALMYIIFAKQAAPRTK